jgi:hypothetical protein
MFICTCQITVFDVNLDLVVCTVCGVYTVWSGTLLVLL